MDYPETVSGEWRAVVVHLPIRIVSEANWRGHYMAQHRRRKSQKKTAELLVKAKLLDSPVPLPVVVTLIRLIGKGGKDFDSDNLISGFKAIRDGAAKALGIDDGDTRAAVWRYEQRKAGEWGCEVRIAQR